ncbi:WW domain-containing adapter protein with coiled-coil homolog isoform X2 [Oscarella lobularis]|uniref:WW domain-containing adapter protein with coiled-coil homolog isoform X2 n=1 Tax=Oscarella lobularis TaxID=121494 RepID=UPI00331325E1
MSSEANAKSSRTSEKTHHPYRSSGKFPPKKAILNSLGTKSSSSPRNEQQPDRSPAQEKKSEQKENVWSEHTSSSGRKYYYNKKTKVSQWEIPEELMKSANTSTKSSPIAVSSSKRSSGSTSQKTSPRRVSGTISFTPVKTSGLAGVTDVSPPSTPATGGPGKWAGGEWGGEGDGGSGWGESGSGGVRWGADTVSSAAAATNVPQRSVSVSEPAPGTSSSVGGHVNHQQSEMGNSNQFTQVYNRQLAMGIYQSLPDQLERQSRMAFDEWLILSSQQAPMLKSRSHISRVWLNRTSIQTMITKHQEQWVKDEIKEMETNSTSDYSLSSSSSVLLSSNRTQ